MASLCIRKSGGIMTFKAGKILIYWIFPLKHLSKNNLSHKSPKHEKKFLPSHNYLIPCEFNESENLNQP